jgi:uncharacterized protein involved in tolerance to divalent cations
MTDKRIVFSTTSSEEEARRIARHLVEHKLAAEGFVAVRDAILELHSYDVPECVAIAVDDGSLEYLEWVADSVRVGEE